MIDRHKIPAMDADKPLHERLQVWQPIEEILKRATPIASEVPHGKKRAQSSDQNDLLFLLTGIADG